MMKVELLLHHMWHKLIVFFCAFGLQLALVLQCDRFSLKALFNGAKTEILKQSNEYSNLLSILP